MARHRRKQKAPDYTSIAATLGGAGADAATHQASTRHPTGSRRRRDVQIPNLGTIGASTAEGVRHPTRRRSRVAAALTSIAPDHNPTIDVASELRQIRDRTPVANKVVTTPTVAPRQMTVHASPLVADTASPPARRRTAASTQRGQAVRAGASRESASLTAVAARLAAAAVAQAGATDRAQKAATMADIGSRRVRGARGATRAAAYAAAHPYTGEAAGPASAEYAIGARMNPEAKSYDIFIDPATGKPDRFSNFEPPILSALDSFVGHDPYGSTLDNLKSVGTELGITALSLGSGKLVEAGLAARAGVATAADYRKFTALLDGAGAVAPKVKLSERLAGIGTKGYTARAAGRAAAARKVITAEKAAADVAGSPRLAAQIGRGVKFAAKGRYMNAARAARRAGRVERTLHNVNPVSAGALGIPQVQAAVKGTGQALNPADGSLIDTLGTTLRAVPGTFAYPVTAAASVVQAGGMAAQDAAAAIQGTTPPNSLSDILGPVKGSAQEGLAAFTGLAPLVSGDSAKVRELIQHQYGLFGVPVLPKLGTRIAQTGKFTALVDKVAETGRGTPTGRLDTMPSKARRLRQVIEGRGDSHFIADSFARHTGASRRASERVAIEIEAELAKAVGAPTLRDVRAHHKANKGREVQAPLDEPGNLVAALARFGVSRHNPLPMLREVVSKLAPEKAGAGVFTMRNAVKLAEKHPEWLSDPHLWKAVDIYKKRAAEITTSERGANIGQGYVFGVTPADKVTPVEARPYTAAKTKEAAHADLRETQAKVKKMRAKAASEHARSRALLREANIYRSRDALRNVNRAQTAKIKRLEQRKAAWEAKAKSAKRPATIAAAKAKVAQIERELVDSRATLASRARIDRITQAAKSRANAKRLLAEAKVESVRAKGLRKALDRYIGPETKASSRTKRINMSDAEVSEFNAKVEKIRGEHPLGAWEEPAYVAEKGGHLEPGNVNVGRNARVPVRQISNFITGAADKADRGLRTLFSDSVYRPRMQNAVGAFVNEVMDRITLPNEINGKKVHEVTSQEAVDLVQSGKVDARDDVFLPSTDYKQAILQGKDVADVRSELLDHLAGEIKVNEGVKGQKYVRVKREAAVELAGQLDPKGSGLESALSAVAKPATRLILMSPTWVQAQLVAEGAQALASAGPKALKHAADTIAEAKRVDRTGYEAVEDIAGESTMAAHTPHETRYDEPGIHQQMGHAARALRGNIVGRAMYAIGSGQMFTIFDQWKSGKYRQVVLVARLNKEIPKFIEGVQGMNREQERISKILAPMSEAERVIEITKHPEIFNEHLKYLNDTQGNWSAFTRFERRFAPALIFYPFLRMGLRWTFWAYPKHHPVKAQILYLLSQRNAQEIDKLTGGAANFLSYAVPVLYGKDGGVSGVLPAGQRFGAPGLNSAIEAIGTGNTASFLRLLNPVGAAGIGMLTGTNPLSGLQTLKPTDPIGLHALAGLNLLLTMAAPARLLGFKGLGVTPAENAAVLRAKELDPNKALRAGVSPFFPQSAEGFAAQTVDSKAYHDLGLGTRSEESQFLARPDVKEFIATGNQAALDAALAQQAKSIGAGDYIKPTLDPYNAQVDPSVEARNQAAIDAFENLQYPSASAADPWAAAGATAATPDPWAAVTPATSAADPWAAAPTNQSLANEYLDALRRSAAGTP